MNVGWAATQLQFNLAEPSSCWRSYGMAVAGHVWDSAAQHTVKLTACILLHLQENAILLEKLVRIKHFDSQKAFKPWLARSTFQYKPGVFYDPTTGAKCVDHINVTASVSPRSVHSPMHRPATAPSSFAATQRYLHILGEVSDRDIIASMGWDGLVL